MVKKKKKTKRRKTRIIGARRVTKLKQSKRQLRQTGRATSNILKAFGVTGGQASQSGPGRPKGTYKYGMPIHEYKRLMTQKRETYREYQMDQLNKFRRRGISPEQVQQRQITRTVERGFPEQEREVRKQDEPEAMADDELSFKQYEADKTLSPSARSILLKLRRIQNKGKSDNIRQQRIQAERRMISEKGNLMKAHENMINVRMDFTGVSNENILMAPNTFKENPENNILRQNRPSLLNTKEMGNDLGF